ncbi:mitochondrial potassium channel ATP-binding subunit isoform X1 [Lacerta agilis]|uniref:mitochondrial potassium channel ATP-binding subunit isoform X1 n=1 Tax=Lacerta agilis TaxID=80427 RepID=UPI00141A47EB|nr:mitochondrial potassium channel ATP-binding subunit isoform X1 [Lacerta agilis]
MLARLLLQLPRAGPLSGGRGGASYCCWWAPGRAAKRRPFRALLVARYWGSHARFSCFLRAPNRLAKPFPAMLLLLPRSLLPLGRVAAFLAGPAFLGLGAGFRRAFCQEVQRIEVVCVPPPVDKEPDFNWAMFWKFLRPQLLALIAAVLFALGAAMLNIQIPLLLGKMVNVVAQHMRVADYIRVARRPALRLLSVYGLQGLMTFGYILLLSWIGERVANRMRKQLFSSFLRQEVAFFDANQTGQLVNRLTTDIQEFKSSFKLVISQGLRSLTQTVGCFVTLYLISPKLTGMLVVVMPILVGAGAYIGGSLRKLSRKAQEQVAKATAVANEALGNVRTVRAFAMEPKELEQYGAEVDQASHLNMKLGLGIAFFQGLSNVALNCIVLGTIFVGGTLLAGEEMTPGDLMSFLVSSQTVQRSLASMSILFGQVVRGMSAAARVFEYMTFPPETGVCDKEQLACSMLSGRIEFHDVTFSYPTRLGAKVLQNFSLTIPANKTVAIVGPSGGGKSTVAALLERFYEPSEGAIFLDGRDICTLDPTWLRGDIIGYINQEPVLFSTSIMENIRFGKPCASDAEIYAAARLANADEFIRSFPDGYNTVVGERGVTLSGGQKQRVAIARALIKNPKVLILDEATSALDAESEHVVQEALDRAVAGRTVLVIAHRLSTVKDADLIVVLSKGHVAESGTHTELLRKGGIYAELIRRQTKDGV